MPYELIACKQVIVKALHWINDGEETMTMTLPETTFVVPGGLASFAEKVKRGKVFLSVTIGEVPEHEEAHP